VGLDVATSTTVRLVVETPDAVGVRSKSSLVMSKVAVESSRRMATELDIPTLTLLEVDPVAEVAEVGIAIVTTPKEAMPQKDKRNFAIILLGIVGEDSLMVLGIVPPLAWLLLACSTLVYLMYVSIGIDVQTCYI